MGASKSAAARANIGNWIIRISTVIMALKGWRRAGVAALAGACAALALAPVYALPLLPIGFSVLILLIDGAKETVRPNRSVFGVGWFFGFGYFLVGLYWMSFSFFVQADEFAWMAPFAMMGMPAFLAFFAGGATLLAAQRWSTNWRRVVVFSVAWAIFEYLRGHILTGLPWNLTGQALAGAAISAQTAAWYGVYGLSFVTVLISVAPAASLGGAHTKGRSHIGLMATLGASALLLAIGAIRLGLPEPVTDAQNMLRIVQPNIPQREKIDPNMWGRNFNRQLELSKGSVPGDTRLYILWPENGAPLLDEAQTALSILSADLPENAVLIAGAVRREVDSDGRDRYFNSIAIVPETSNGRQPTAFYDKHHLVPFGEYLPFYSLLDAIGLAQLAPYGDAGFTAGSGPINLNVGGTSFSPLICYEVIFPGRMYPKGERPEWLLTVTNDAWFGDTSGPRQHLDQARLRSIETGLPMARSANTGISAVIDGKGRILDRVDLYEEGRIDIALPPALARPVYDRFGDGIFALMLAVGLSVGLRR